MTSIRLARPSSNTPWGFRIHGGKDFNQPLIILKVNSGSIAEQTGLSPGDAILQINSRDALNLKHKEAQDLMLLGGNCLDFVVAKGATSTWAPKVTPLGQLNPRQPTYTKTSLKKEHGPAYVPRPGINTNAKPFESYNQQTLVNKQFNSPINLYSEQNLANTMSAQAEVLAGGAIGVNFKKNEKDFKMENSEVYKMLQEVEKEPALPPPRPHSQNEEHGRTIPIAVTPYCSSQKSPVQPSSALPSQQSLLKSVQAPYTKPDSNSGGHNPNLCAECERLIVGVFVRIKDKNMHVECFKCTTCGTSLKNIGYFNINNKLYCDVHAKCVAKVNPPTPGYEPYATFPRTNNKQVNGNLFGTNDDLLLKLYKTNEPQNFSSSLQTYTNLEEKISSTLKSGMGRSIPINYSPGAHPTVDTYANTMAPMPYHHSPTQTHHVTAPKSPNIAPTQNHLFPSGLGSGSKIYESKTSSSFSETITKSGGSKFVWPPPKAEDEVMMGSNLTPGGLQSSRYMASDSTYSSFGSGSNPATGSGGITLPITPYTPLLAPTTYNPPNYKSLGGSGYKPVTKPTFKPQAPYKSNMALLTTANPTAGYVPPPFAPSSLSPSYGTGSGLQAGPPAVGRGKGQFSRGILPTRGKGILTQPGPRIAVCASCNHQIRGPFVSAGGNKIYCPEHFKCHTPSCRRPLIDIGFVEERGGLYCEYCWESYLAPECSKCRRRIKNECLNAIGQHFHPTCFLCAHCGFTFNNNPFYLEDGKPYCEKDWNEMFTTKCFACGFSIEAGDRWVEALSNNYHSQCFNCSACKKNLEGQSFFAKGGRPFCKQHGR